MEQFMSLVWSLPGLVLFASFVAAVALALSGRGTDADWTDWPREGQE
ncbi:hypothetical protein [Glycomyces tenuis]|nr:hypothetical protein [Glycomyces tenuis]